MERIVELAKRKFLDFRISDRPIFPPTRIRSINHKKFMKYLLSIGAEFRNDILPEEDHLGKAMAQIMDGEEPEPDDQWQKRCHEHLQNIAQKTGKFPVPMSFAYNKGFLLPNDLAQKILALNSFPPEN